MDITVGKRIAVLRKEKGLRQEDLAQLLGISGQAVSKWENDQTCPDISLLPELAIILGVTVDELLSGRQETASAVRLIPEEKRKNIQDLMLRVFVESQHGDRVRVNLPMALVQVAIDCGMELPQISGIDALKKIDWNQIMAMISQGVVGNLVEVESSKGDIVQIYVE